MFMTVGEQIFECVSSLLIHDAGLTGVGEM